MRPWFKRRKRNSNLVNAVHLKDWLHNELAGTDDPGVEQAYYGVIARVDRMLIWASAEQETTNG